MAKVIPFLTVLLTSCTTLPAPSDDSLIDVCEIVAHPNDFIGQTVLVDVRIELDNHGVYSNGDECDEIHLWTGAAKNDELVIQQIWSVGKRYPQPSPLARVKGNIVMQDYRLPLTDHVSPRLRLDVLEIVSVEPVQ